ncbi:MAG: thiamine pyrophosphate-binding protein, partial [Gammaproteobacteria bacterium]
MALPEDLQGPVPHDLPTPHPKTAPAPEPAADAVGSLETLLGKARQPIVIAGGSGWTEAGTRQLRDFAERWRLPVSVVFRRQQLFDHDHPNYAGDCGIGINPALRRRIEDADLVVLLGTRFSEIPSQGYTLLEEARPGKQLVHVHASEGDRFPHANLVIRCHPERLLAALDGRPTAATQRDAVVVNARAEFEAWS